MHPKITLYTKGYCPFCKATKALFASKGLSFLNHDLEIHPERRDEMIAKSNGRKTVPQIFVGDIHIGGHSDLAALDAAGKLDALLGRKQPA